MILYRVPHLPLILQIYYILLSSDCQLLFSESGYPESLRTDFDLPDSFHR